MTPFFEWLDSVPLWIYLGGFLTASVVLFALDVRLRRRAGAGARPSEARPPRGAPALRVESVTPLPKAESGTPRRRETTRRVS